MKKINNGIVILLFVLGLSSMIIGLFLQFKSINRGPVIESVPYQRLTYNTESYRYLSDIDYIKEQSNVAWGSILLDQSADTKINNGLITLIVDGKKTPFIKGVFAHATSTVVYDISSYDYDFFTAYLGVDASRENNGNGVKFAIYTSTDGENWDLRTAEKPPVLKGTSEALSVKIDIKGVKYLKLYAHNNGNESSDHAVYADAKLIKEDYVEDTSTVDFIKTVEEYDNILANTNVSNALVSNELTVLQREFVKNVGYDVLQAFVRYNDDNKQAISWLMNDLKNLKLYITGGAPEGSYINSIKVLSELYKNYKQDFNNTEVTKYGTVLGDLYTRMALSLSLTHSKLVGLWMQASQPENQSNAVVRYALYKQMHADGHFVVTDSIDITKWFESYSIEEMRFVMNNNIDDEEILWLNEYTQSFVDKNPNQPWKYLTPHPYMAYVWPNYGREEFHDPERYDYWDEKFNGIFSKYNVTYRPGLYKVWMNFRNEFGTGAVCGGISKTGSNIRGSHGIPSAVIGQPGHAAIIYYTQDAQGRGYWGIDNDVSGWTLSEKGERMLLGWGNASYTRGSYQVVYMALAQEVLNDYETYEKSKEMVVLAQAYENDLAKQEEAYRKALEIQPLNIDAWYGLINNFNANEAKTENDYYALVEELTSSLKYFPLPMYQLSNLIKPKLVDVTNSYKFMLLQTRTLKEASVVPNNDTENYYVYQPSLTRVEANYLLGKVDNSIATFSFDGDDAGKIVLSSRFDGNGVRWDYSLDGKKNWEEKAFTAEEEHKLQLTEEELNSISDENDIYVHIVGVNYDEENLYKIDIHSTKAPKNLYNNDLENKVIGATDTMEWRLIENTSSSKKNSKVKSLNNWTSFGEELPDLTGDKTVEVRYGRHGVNLESESLTFEFTKDKIDETKKYVSIEHLSIDSYSTQSKDGKRPYYAPNAIDGNAYTLWHTDFSINVLNEETKPFITIKLDVPKVISEVEFLPIKYKTNDPCDIKNATVYISDDGTNWTEAGKVENLEQNQDMKKVPLDKSVSGQYVKLEFDTYNMFAAVAMINLYEDTTKRVAPTASIEYSTTEPTNKDVTVRLVNPSTDITITNNNASSEYTFSENGVFVFEFVDSFGTEGKATAIVNNIDKVAPKAEITYSTKDKTEDEVVVTLTNESEPITIVNNDGNNTYTFKENGTFEFIFRDKAGNESKIEVIVDWIISDDTPVNPGDEENPGDKPENPDDDKKDPDKENPGEIVNPGDDDKPENPDNNDNSEDNEKPEDKPSDSGNENTGSNNENNDNPMIVEVPNTATTGLLTTIGVAITACGITFVKKHSNDFTIDE